MNTFLRCKCGSVRFKNLKRAKHRRRGHLKLAGTCESCGHLVETVVKDDPYDPIRPVHT